MTESKKTSASAGGVGFSGALTLLFVGLKLTGNIGWSWVWVLSPLWGSLALLFAFLAVAFGVFTWIEYRGRNR